MILVDANLLLYAQNTSSPEHSKAKSWWDKQLSGTELIGLSWTVLTAFIRIGTNPRIFAHPLTLTLASNAIQSWFDQPNTRLVHPTDATGIPFASCSKLAKPLGTWSPTPTWQRLRSNTGADSPRAIRIFPGFRS